MEEKKTNAWLIWVGAESYGKIEDWASEAVTQGISKRLPSVGAGKALMAENTVIFVAHDEGEYHSCKMCPGTIECPACRKRLTEIDRLNKELSALELPYESITHLLDTAPQSVKRSYKLRADKRSQIEIDMSNCEVCSGKLTVEDATGGHIVLLSGAKMDYRQYNYWLHQPTKFDPSTVAEKHMCEACGGTGMLPDAHIFGLFVPERIEYIVDGTESEDEMAKVRDFAKITTEMLVAEKDRKCGRRKPKGVYVVTSVEGTGAAKTVVDKLVESGAIEPDACEVNGSFIRFLSPVPVCEKRFRGIKHWTPSPDLEAQASDILEALA